MNKRTTLRIAEAMQTSKQGLKVKLLQISHKQQDQIQPQSNALTKNKINPQDQKVKAKEMLEYLQRLLIY